MSLKSQTKPPKGPRILLLGIVLVSIIPALGEAAVLGWGIAQGYWGKALRDGVDFWAGGFLARHNETTLLFDPIAYRAFLHGTFGDLPVHMWSYAPNYLLLVSGFAGLSPWHATLAFDAFSLLGLALVLRLAKQSWWLIGAVLLSPAALENLLAGQNAALVTTLVGGGILLIPTRPRLGGALVGLASIKPQLGLVLPLYVARQAPIAVLYATLAALLLGAAAVWAFGVQPWVQFWHITRPAMTAVLSTGQPADFANGLVSVFAAFRPLGIGAAVLAQGLVSLTAVILAASLKNPAPVLILAVLASPYLHSYDLLCASLAVALLVQNRLASGFAPGEKPLFLAAWMVPGLVLWLPPVSFAVPVILGLLLASALRRGPVAPCDS
ncbi:MAG: glycosyltransferase family 87 protein [Acidocella sp.]|nr:glycosyltransferase family 87 protein [Acidocella sp.]